MLDGNIILLQGKSRTWEAASRRKLFMQRSHRNSCVTYSWLVTGESEDIERPQFGTKTRHEVWCCTSSEIVERPSFFQIGRDGGAGVRG